MAAAARTHGPALLQGCAEPHHELLAMVWGPRFDLQQALDLMERGGQTSPNSLPGVLRVADAFDRLPHPQQARVRTLIQRHQRVAQAA